MKLESINFAIFQLCTSAQKVSHNYFWVFHWIERSTYEMRIMINILWQGLFNATKTYLENNPNNAKIGILSHLKFTGAL